MACCPGDPLQYLMIMNPGHFWDFWAAVIAFAVAGALVPWRAIRNQGCRDRR